MSRSKSIPFENRGNLTLAEAMQYAGLGHAKASRLIKEGEWEAFPCGREIRVIRVSIDEWMKRESEAYRKKLNEENL